MAMTQTSPAGVKTYPSLPTKIKFSVVGSTVTKVKVDKTLIRNSDLFGNPFKVPDGIFV
jgi:hypothetical protein